MREKHCKTEYASCQDTYQTGSTRPPKDHHGMIAFLLGLVILLCGISTVMGLLNIRLFRQLNDQTEATQAAIAFSRSAAAEAACAEETPLGFTGETITEFWHTYHELPRGVFIQTVEYGSDASRLGIVPGDILVSVNGAAVDGLESLNQALQNCLPGESVLVEIWRDHQQYHFTLTLDERN